MIKIIAAIIVATVASSAAAQQRVAKVDWDAKDIVEARTENRNLVDRGSGFESSGSGDLSEVRLPVFGPLPSSLGVLFASRGSPLESAPTDAPERVVGRNMTVTPVMAPNKLSYSLSYQNISIGLDAICTGSRVVRAPPNGLSAQGLLQAQTQGAEGNEEINVASWQERRYGILYSCSVHCSEDTAEFCSTDKFARGMLVEGKILNAGTKD